MLPEYSAKPKCPVNPKNAVDLEKFDAYIH